MTIALSYLENKKISEGRVTVAEIIFLSDIIEHGPMGRYVAPYLLASQCEKQGIQTQIVDYFSKFDQFFALMEEILSPETVIVAISSTFLRDIESRGETEAEYWQTPLCFSGPVETKNWLKILKTTMERIAPHSRLVIGGAKSILLRSQKALEYYSEIDHLVLGRGEEVIIELYNKIKEKNDTIPRLLEVNNQTYENCPPLSWNPSWQIQKGEALSIEISRGCLYSCRFCRYDKKTSIKKNLEELRNELIENYEKFGTTVYQFTDDCINDHQEKIVPLCEMILDLPFSLEWVAYARTDLAIKRPETLELMMQSGVSALYWGVESLEQEAARRAGKASHSEKVKELFRLMAKEYSQQCLHEISLIVGLPGETPEQFQKNFSFFLEEDICDVMSIYPLGLFPYLEELDQTVIDFADYSRQPEKYGFQEVRFQPDYWKHQEMDLDQAKDLAKKANLMWQKKNPSELPTVWSYPALRTLGLTKKEVFKIFRNEKGRVAAAEIKNRWEHFLARYFQSLSL